MEYVKNNNKIAGQEDFDELRPLSYPDSHVFILGFDVSNVTSLENIESKWIKEGKFFI
jgi:GTPase SAR1 family protein